MNAGPYSLVGIGTRYVLYCSSVEFRRWLDFPHPFTSAPGPTQPSVQWEPYRFLGVKHQQRSADHPA
jgi:hypothetical protein